MHATCTRTTATTASGCHPPSTVLVGANNNSSVVDAEGSLTHSARCGLTSVWHRRHRTHSTIIHARISYLTHTNTQKWEGDSVKQRPHAGITDHTRHNSDASRQPPTQNKEKLHVLWNIPAIRTAKRTITLPFSLHSPFIFPMRAPQMMPLHGENGCFILLWCHRAAIRLGGKKSKNRRPST
ncbi:hypothetical protein TcCL_Unassigned02449 [Trypanosoma cruzi]|nr:hypothetical protein TcCL_Unassigned02449 [Trypanosoma cruzi]